MKTSKKTQAHSERERGQSMTELALVLPLLVLVIIGGIDLARVYDSYVSITNAAREGARYAASRPSASGGEVLPRVLQELSGTGIPEEDVTVFAPACVKYSTGASILCKDALTGDYITVRVSVPFRFLSLFVMSEPNSILNISNATTMPVVLP